MADLTRVANALTPDVWDKYFNEFTAELSAIRQSGIMETLAGFNVPSEGKTVNMPFWQDLTGEDEIWTSGHETQPEAIFAKKDAAVILTRIKSYGAEDLVKLFSGSDPMAAIVLKFANYWNRREQLILLSILKGVFGTALAENMKDKSSESISRNMLVDAINVMGDASTDLTGMLMHSAVQADLAKKSVLDARVNVGDTNAPPEFETFLKRRIIVDDGAPVENVGTSTDPEMVYTTYLFGQGALAYAAGTPDNSIEIVREGLKSQTSLVHRRQFIMHPRGVSWVGNPVKNTPSNAELATAANWVKVFERKNIPIVALRHQIG